MDTNRIIYFDNGATTPICEEAKAAAIKAFDDFGNPSSLYSLGVVSSKIMKTSSKKLGNILRAEEGTFYFTSGATEANNWAIFGAAQFNIKNGRHIITSKTEHPSVLEPFYFLEKQGFSVTYIGCDKKGNLNKDELYEQINENTVLISIMNVNNETGVINNVEEIGRKVKSLNKSVVFHVDAVAAFCKIPISVVSSNIDLLSVSGHKVHAPKGIGGLYVKKGTKINPLILGGGQQNNMRSGTENIPFIASFAESASALSKEMAQNYSHAASLKQKLICGINNIQNAQIIGEITGENSSPYVLCAAFGGMKSQIIINALEQRNIFVSAGSACSSNKNTLNKSLHALGIDDELVDGAIRFTFSKYNSEEQIDFCLNALTDILCKYKGMKK